MSSTKPLISIVIAVRNDAASLPRCLDSIREQTWTGYEVVIIDGASDDGTLDVIHANEDLLAYWVSEPDSGIYDAFNKGIAATSGEWIAFLGADDEFARPDVLARVADSLQAVPDDTQFVYGSIEHVRDGAVVGRKGSPWRSPWRWPDRYFRVSLPIAHSGAMHQRDAFDEFGMFDTDYHIAGDSEFLLRILKSSDPVFIPDLVIVKKALGGVSNDPRHAPRLVEEARRLRVAHGLRPGIGWQWLRLRNALKVLAHRPGSPLGVLLWIKRRL